MNAVDRVSTTSSISQLRDFSTRRYEPGDRANGVMEENPDKALNEAPQKVVPEITLEAAIEGVEVLNETMKLYNHKLHFEVHEDTKRLKVAIVDKMTDEIIKEIPPEEVLDMLARIHDMIGFLVDKRI